MTLLQKTTDFFNQPRLWPVIALLSLIYGNYQRHYHQDMMQFILALVVCIFACSNYNSSKVYQTKKQKLIAEQKEEINQFWDELKAAGTSPEEILQQEEVIKRFGHKFKTNSYWEQLKKKVINQIKLHTEGSTAVKKASAHNLLSNASIKELRAHLNKDEDASDNLLLTVQAFYRLKTQMEA